MSVNKIEEDKYQATSSFDDDLELDARPAQDTSTITSIGSGWDDAEKLSVSTSQYPTEFRQSDRAQLIKFLDPSGPFATYKMHFLSQKTEGKRSYVCLGAVCPLCNILGHKAEDKRSFTIVNFSADTGFTRQILTATPRLYRTLAQANSEKFGPLNKHFWSLSRTGKMQTTVYNLIPVKERDLVEEYDLNVDEVNDFLSAVEPYVRSDIREHSVAELTEIANDLL